MTQSGGGQADAAPALPTQAGARTRRDFLPNLQIVRFAAASMVLWHHLLQELATPRLGLPLTDPIGIEGSTGVDIFFMVSGFVMCFLTFDHFAETGYWVEFLRRRLVRVVPLYWLFTTLFLILIVAAPGAISHSDLSIGRIASSYLFIPWPRAGGDVYPILALGWTLNYEMLFYAVFAVSLLFARRTAFAGLALVFLSAVILGRFAPASWLMVRFWTDPIVLEFLAGVGLCWGYLRGVRLPGFVRAGLIVAGLGLSILFTRIDLIGHDDLRLLWAGLPALLIAMGSVWGAAGSASSAADLSLPMRLLVLGGDASYSLYLSHMFSVRLLTTAWVKLHLHSPWAYMAAGMVFSTLVAIFVYLWVEKPVLAWLKTVVKPRADVTA